MSRNIDTMRFKNPTNSVVKLEAVGLDDVAPGGEVEIPLAICAPGRADGGGRKLSPIESVAPQLIPVDPADHMVWKKVPPVPAPISKIVSVNNNKAPSEPAGVKALRESLAKKAQEAKGAPQANVSKPAEGQKG